MIRRAQFCAWAVTLLATERQLDFVVTHQASRHLRHVYAADGVRGIDAAMARETGIRAVQLRAKIARGREVLARVDRLRDNRGHVAELQVFFVAEMRETCLRGQRNGDAFMARLAYRGRRQIVVLNPSAMRDRGVATGAVRLQFQVDAMRERRCARACTQRPRQNRDGAYELQLAL